MVSINYWYKKLYDGFFKDLKFGMFVNSDYLHHDPFYIFSRVPHDEKILHDKQTIVFFDQEPFERRFMDSALRPDPTNENLNSQWARYYTFLKFFVVSEKSRDIDLFCKSRSLEKIYYFSHALLANDWYRNYWKDDINIEFEHEYLFVNYQHVLNPKRSYRVDFMCRANDCGLLDHGLTSFKSPGINEIDNILKQTPEFSEESWAIYKKNQHILDKNYIIDTKDPHGALSTSIDIENSKKCFLHVVSETVYYSKKLHLTEKVFKPIVIKQPFVLLAAPGNLDYLKSYGFKTFSNYWDESYDSIEDPGQRMAAVIKILENLKSMSYKQRVEMKKDMQDILQYNFDHFYHDLKHIVADEFITNSKESFSKFNINISDDHWKKLYKILTF
jgi:hypothetical protein